MKYGNYLLQFMLLISISYSAKGQIGDSLVNVLDTASNPKTKLAIFDALGKEELRKNQNTAIGYYKEYLSLAKKNQLVREESYAYKQMGMAWYYADSIKKSTAYYFKSLEALGDIPDHELMARNFNNLGWNFQVEHELDLAIEYFTKAEVAADKGNNRVLLGLILNNLGVTLKNKGDRGQALEVYKRSLAINREQDNIERQIFNLNNISILYLQESEYSKSIQYLKEAKPLIIATQDSVELANYLTTYGEVLLATKQYKMASDTLELASNIAGLVGLTSQQMTILFILSEAYENQGRYMKALNIFKKYYQMNLEYQAEENAAFINELNLKYNVSQKEKELQIAENKNLEQRIYLLIIASGLFMAVFAIFFIIRLTMIKTSKNKELRAKMEEIAESNTTIKEQNDAIIAKSEELNAANLEIQTTNKKLEQLVEERTLKLQQKNDKLTRYAHMTAHDIRGPLARILGLVSVCNEDSFDDFLKLSDMVKQAAHDLDERIRIMTKLLDDEDLEIDKDK